MVTESALSRIRKERCPKCADGWDQHRSSTGELHHRNASEHPYTPCTAPSAEQLVEELAGRLAEAERVYEKHLDKLIEVAREQEVKEAADTERLDWLDSRGDLGSIEIDPDLPGETTEVHWNKFVGVAELNNVRAAIDAARETQKENTE